MKKIITLLIFLVAISVSGCFSTHVKLFSKSSDPLHEYKVKGKGEQKILMITVKGVISDSPKSGLFESRPGMVQEVLAQLEKAEKDQSIKAVVLKVDSPGGTIVASDIIYHQLMEFKKRTGKKIVVMMMNMAASGGYYISLPADHIVSHPTTITGSVGAIFVRPKFKGLMDKIGVGVEVSKSGKNKDMGSPYKESNEDEAAYFQNIIDKMASRFSGLVQKHRNLSPETMKTVRAAGVFLSEEAKSLGLIDEIGYMENAIEKARSLSGIEGEYKLVVYRREHFSNDTVYNNVSAVSGGGSSPISIKIQPVPELKAGFYYLTPLFSFNEE